MGRPRCDIRRPMSRFDPVGRPLLHVPDYRGSRPHQEPWNRIVPSTSSTTSSIPPAGSASPASLPPASPASAEPSYPRHPPELQMTSTISTHTPTRPPRRPPPPPVPAGCRAAPSTDPRSSPTPACSTRRRSPRSTSTAPPAGGLVGLQVAADCIARRRSSTTSSMPDSRARRRRLPDRAQVADRGGQRPQHEPVDGGRQRRRGRAGNVQGPQHPAAQPLPGDRRSVRGGPSCACRSGHHRPQAVVRGRGGPGPRAALDEIRAANVLPEAIGCSVFEGPDEYLYGEETALLEDDRRPWSVPSGGAAVPCRPAWPRPLAAGR